MILQSSTKVGKDYIDMLFLIVMIGCTLKTLLGKKERLLIISIQDRKLFATREKLWQLV